MTIASEIQRIQTNIANAYDAAEAKGATMPATEDSANLATTIASIAGGGGGDIITATNTTGSVISSGDKVWINKSGNNYELVNYYSSVPNFDVVGSPTITNGIASGFSTSDYFKTTNNFNPASLTWSIKLKFTTGPNVIDNTIIGSAYNNYIENILLRINSSKKMWFLLSTSSGGWDIIGTSTEGSYTFLENTTYYVEALYDGTNYIFKYSTDGINYTTDINVQSVATIGSGIIQFGAHTFLGMTDAPFKGSIDLSESYIKIGGATWWTPYLCNINPDSLTGVAKENIAINNVGTVSTVLEE